MIGYFGHYRSTEVEVEILNPVEAAITGAGKITCPECGGDGDWEYGAQLIRGSYFTDYAQENAAAMYRVGLRLASPPATAAEPASV